MKKTHDSQNCKENFQFYKTINPTFSQTIQSQEKCESFNFNLLRNNSQ